MSPFFAPLAEPLGAIWALMVCGLIWLMVRRQWRSAFWLGLPVLLLFLVGSTPLADTLVAGEERQWTQKKFEVRNLRSEGSDEKSAIGNRQSPRVYDCVVALGGGERMSQHDLLGFAEGDGGSRVLTAVQLVRSGKAKTLVLGGSCDPLPGKPNVPSMMVVQRWIMDWGLVSNVVVTNLGFCRNTHDEALTFRRLATARGWTNAILVTSALHLRRGVALFKKQGIDVLPVAADFQACGVSAGSFSPFPRQGNFFHLALYLHEKIGWWVYRWRGWI